MDNQPCVHIPETVSPQAQEFLRTLKEPALIPRFPDPADIAGWKKLQAWADPDGKAKSEPLLKRYEHTVEKRELGGVPVLDIRPKDWKGGGKVLVYTHGGAHVMYSAASMLGRAVVAAHSTGLRVLSVDCTLAPHAKYDAMPAAAVLVSAWLDVTTAGDTETTLHDADPNQLHEKHGKFAAAAFADPKDQKDPYASPVYGDFSKGFPPTLIQGGLKETLLSGFVRLYQALDTAEVPVKLDPYKGMIHNFQDRIPDAPESILARGKMRDFLNRRLGVAP